DATDGAVAVGADRCHAAAARCASGERGALRASRPAGSRFRMRRALGFAAAVVLAAAGVVALLLAFDVARTHSRIAADDVAYRTAPRRSDLWQAPHVLPASWSLTLLRLDADLRARRALHGFKPGHPRLP